MAGHNTSEQHASSVSIAVPPHVSSPLRARPIGRGVRWASLVIVLAAATVFLGACRPRAQPAHPLRWAKAWIGAVNSHRTAYFAALLGSAGTYEDPLSGGPQSALTLRLLLLWRWRHFPDLHYEIESVTGNSELVAVEWKATGSVAATKERPLRGVFVIQLQGDSIAGVRAYYDARAISSGRPG